MTNQISAANKAAYLDEFRGRYHIVIASAVGLTAGMSATMFYSLGTFILPLQAEFNWSRGDISLGATFLTFAIFITGTTAGRLSDRFGAAAVGSLSLLSYAVGVILMAIFIQNIVHFWISYFLISILGVGSTPIVLIKPITQYFVRARGIALGVALTGAGISGFWVPRLVAMVTQTYGWRAAYISLALIAIAVAPLVWFGFREKMKHTKSQVQSSIMEGVEYKEARRTTEFWFLSLMSITMALGIAGVIVHLVPYYSDLGADPLEAAKIASFVGIASVAGRVIIGVVLDHVPAAAVASSVLLLAALGVYILSAYGLQYAWLATILIGLAAGAEIDLLAYLTVSFFGRRHYGALYGWQYSIFALGYGISPYLVGVLYERFGSYSMPLLISILLLIGAALCCLALPKSSIRAKAHSH